MSTQAVGLGNTAPLATDSPKAQQRKKQPSPALVLGAAVQNALTSEATQEIFHHVIHEAIKPDPVPKKPETWSEWFSKNKLRFAIGAGLATAVAYETGLAPYIGAVATASPFSVNIFNTPIDINLITGTAIGAASYIGYETAEKHAEVFTKNKVATGLGVALAATNGLTGPIVSAAYYSGAWKFLGLGAAVKYGVLPQAEKLLKKTKAKKQALVQSATDAVKAKAADAGNYVLDKLQTWKTNAIKAATPRLQQARTLAGQAATALKAKAVAHPKAAFGVGTALTSAVAVGVGVISAPTGLMIAGSVGTGLLIENAMKN